MAHCLANQYQKTPKDEMMHSIKIASPTREFKPNTTFHNTGIAFVELQPGMQDADIIFLAIPGKAIPNFIDEHTTSLSHALIVDINNDPTAHEAEAFENNNLRWVKGFNDVGAIDLLNRKSKSRPKTRMSAMNTFTLAQVKTFAEEALGFDVQVIVQDRRKATEQGSIGKEWKHAAYIAIFFFIFFTIFVACAYFVRWPYPWNGMSHEYPILFQNKAMASTALSLFALSLIPGTYVRLVKAWKDDTMYILHPATIWALSIRKHVGLMGLYFVFLHAIFSLLELGPAHYYWFAFDSTDSQKMNLIGELSLMFGVISFSLFIITGIGSLPSVGDAMNKAQFDFVYGPVVWMGLIMGHLHCVIIYFTTIERFGMPMNNGGMPHISLVASLLPWFAITLKFIQLLGSFILPIIWARTRKDKIQTTEHGGYGSKRGGFSIRNLSSRQSASLTVEDETKHSFERAVPLENKDPAT